MEVVETGLVDPTQFDPSSKYHDAASKPEAPRWDCVRLAYRGRFRRCSVSKNCARLTSQSNLPWCVAVTDCPSFRG